MTIFKVLFSYLEWVCCSMSSSNCCFLTCIQVSQKAGQVVWYSHLFQNLPHYLLPSFPKATHRIQQIWAMEMLHFCRCIWFYAVCWMSHEHTFNPINVLFISSVYFGLYESKWIYRFEIRKQKGAILNKYLPFPSPYLSPWHIIPNLLSLQIKKKSFIF